MKINTSELEGAALDWAVAQVDPQCEGLEWARSGSGPMVVYGDIGGKREPCLYLASGVRLRIRIRLRREDIFGYSPSTDWSQGGPLMDSYARHMEKYPMAENEPWVVGVRDDKSGECGDTLLIAAMRAIVAAELGDEVGVPDELAT